MADFNKVGLLILNENNTKFMVCEKHPKEDTTSYIMPGGRIENESDTDCIKREIKEELNTEVDLEGIEYIGEYVDVAAGHPGKNVSIKLYKGTLKGKPVPSSEIKYIHWIGKEQINDPKLSPILKNKIITDLVQRKILK